MPFGIQNRFGLRPWERESEIRSFSPEEAEQSDPALLDNLVKAFQQPEQEIQTPVFDRYLEEIQNAPRREDFQAGTGRKILAGLAGAAAGFTGGAGAGARTVQEITEGPYQKAQQDFRNRIEPLEKGVGFEKSFSETARKSMNDKNNRGFKLADLEGKRTKALGDLEIAERNAKTREELARIQGARAEVEAEHKRQLAQIGHRNAGAREVAAQASQTRANRPPGTGSQAKPHTNSPTQQIAASKLAKQKALDETLKVHPMIGAALDPKTGEIVFADDVSEEDQERFMDNYEANKPLVEREILKGRVK